MSTVFISYRRQTAPGEARALFNDLTTKLGKSSVFMDVDSIALGRDFRGVLQKTLGSCDLMLVIIDKDWVSVKDEKGKVRLENPADYVRQEVEAALKRDIVVTPVLVKGAQMPSPEDLPAEIRELVYRNAFELTYNRWESDVAEMVRRLGLGPQEPTVKIETFHRPEAPQRAPSAPSELQYPLPMANAEEHAARPSIFSTIRSFSFGQVLRLGSSAKTKIILILVLLPLVAVIGVFVSTVGHQSQPEKSGDDHKWTAWMDRRAYQAEFERQVKNEWYPNLIEAQLQEHIVKYRAVFVPFPRSATEFQFQSAHSVNDEEFAKLDAELTQRGLKRIFQQRITVEGRPFNQATWIQP